MRYYFFLIVFSLGARCARSFWPPAYKVDLNDRKVFVIASDETDYDEESENEMIRGADLDQFESLATDEEKYKPLHSHVERYNKRAARTATEFADVFPLFQPNMEDIHNLVEEAKPFVAGFKHELDEYDFDDLEERVFKAFRKKRNASDPATVTTPLTPPTTDQNAATELGEMKSITIEENTREFNTTTSSQISVATQDGEVTETQVIPDKGDKESEDVAKDDESTTELKETRTTEMRKDDSKDQVSNEKGEGEEEEDYDYNYHQFKVEYYEQIEYGKSDNKTFNYTDHGEAEESAEDAIKKIIDFKMPRNCTREELTEFGAKALECLVYDYKNAKNEKNVRKILSRTWVVLRVWICVYLFFAIPCWCQKGWCCCCFNCAFCNPEDKILTAKKYYAENPPGVLTEYEDGEKGETKITEFEPTFFELEAYEKFESAIRNL